MKNDDNDADDGRLGLLCFRALERDSEVSRKAKVAAGKAKEAMQKFDSEFSVSQRAKEAARRTTGAAQQTSRDLGVSDKAAEAAKAAEKVCVCV